MNSSDHSDYSAPAITRWLTDNIARLAELPCGQIDPNTPVVDFGTESLSLPGLAGGLAGWLKHDISPTLLWQYPTIAELATHLAATPATARRALVPLQMRDSEPPFYLIHEVSATLIPYRHLLEHWGDERMIYGFEVPFGEDEADQIESIEALAARYMAELRASTGRPLLSGQLFDGRIGGFRDGLSTARAGRNHRIAGINGHAIPPTNAAPGQPTRPTSHSYARLSRFAACPTPRAFNTAISAHLRSPAQCAFTTRRDRSFGRQVFAFRPRARIYPMRCGIIIPAPSTARWFI